MEARLIKDIRPASTRSLDDKTYPYLAVTTRDEFPGVFITRNRPPTSSSKARSIFGPFTSVYALRESVAAPPARLQVPHLPPRHQIRRPKNAASAPACSTRIDQCTAPCANKHRARSPYRRISTASCASSPPSAAPCSARCARRWRRPPGAQQFELAAVAPRPGPRHREARRTRPRPGGSRLAARGHQLLH
jgi:hypothetical protein